MRRRAWRSPGRAWRVAPARSFRSSCSAALRSSASGWSGRPPAPGRSAAATLGAVALDGSERGRGKMGLGRFGAARAARSSSACAPARSPLARLAAIARARRSAPPPPAGPSHRSAAGIREDVGAAAAPEKGRAAAGQWTPAGSKPRSSAARASFSAVSVSPMSRLIEASAFAQEAGGSGPRARRCGTRSAPCAGRRAPAPRGPG